MLGFQKLSGILKWLSNLGAVGQKPRFQRLHTRITQHLRMINEGQLSDDERMKGDNFLFSLDISEGAAYTGGKDVNKSAAHLTAEEIKKVSESL